MPRLLVIVLLVGLVSGLLVGGFHNLFTVPVIERAMDLEEERAVQAAGGLIAEEDGTEVSRGGQRAGMVVGWGIFGSILGLVFAGGFTLLRRVVPGWQPLALTLVVGCLGFWAISLFPFIRYPLNPPGVGEETTLAARQGYQVLFMLLSAAGVAVLLLALDRVNSLAFLAPQRLWGYGSVLLAYTLFAVIIVFALPANPDPVDIPIDLLELFRTLTMAGHFLFWMLLAAGVGFVMMWYQRPDLGTRESARRHSA